MNNPYLRHSGYIMNYQNVFFNLDQELKKVWPSVLWVCSVLASCSLNSLISVAVPDVHPVFPLPSVLKVSHVKLSPSSFGAWTSRQTHTHARTLSLRPEVFWKKTVFLSFCLNKRVERALLVCWARNAICSWTGILMVAQLNSAQRYLRLLFVLHPWGGKKKIAGESRGFLPVKTWKDFC